MSDIFKVKLDKCGVGGVTCVCCNPFRHWASGKSRKFRGIMTRQARARLKRDDAGFFDEGMREAVG